jgi:hypothetical protein
MEKDYIKERIQRIEDRKRYIKSKKNRKLMKYTSNYNEMFNFFLKSYRVGILNFCGVKVDVKFNTECDDGKFSFRLFDNGYFKGKVIECYHPNILKGVIIGKKSWGLWKTEFSMGIAENNFTKEEILLQFIENDIKIPDVFIKELDLEI